MSSAVIKNAIHMIHKDTHFNKSKKTYNNIFHACEIKGALAV